MSNWNGRSIITPASDLTITTDASLKGWGQSARGFGDARNPDPEADWESRPFRDSSNWKLNPTVFQALNHLWGPLTIYLFADRMNTQLQSYISWFPDPLMGQMHFRFL